MTSVARPAGGTRSLLAPAAAPLVILAVQLVVFPLPVGPWLSGAILGVAGALGAVGLALIWRANRVVNFAQGDLGAFPATLAVLLITISGLPWILGVTVGVVAAVTVGVLADVLVVRRFARSPRLMLTVATLGIAQVLAFGSLLLPRLWGEGPAIRRIPPPIDVSLSVGGVTFNGNDLIAVGVAPVLLVAVAIVLRRTDTGVAVRAASERIDRAAGLGVAVQRLETRVWVLATLLSFASVMLTAGISSLPFGLGLGLSVLVRALAAVVVGRMTHLVVIGASAVALGVLESGVRWNTGDTALMAPLLAVAVIASLLWYRTGTTRADRDETSSWRAGTETHDLPVEVRRDRRVRLLRWGGWVALVVVVVAGPALLGTNGQLKAGVVTAFATVGVSIVVLTGWTGQVSLGQMAFVGTGAAIGAVGMAEHGWDPFVALLAGGIVGAVVAVLVGLPALRVRGLYLAVVTLALGIAASEWIFSNRAADWIPEGSFPRPALFHRLDLDTPLRLYWFGLGVLALVLVALLGVRRSRTGRVLIALRDNEPNVVAFGISPVRAKLSAFALSGFVAAAAGVVIVVQQGAFRQQTFGPEESVSALVATVVGGMGTLAGGVVGAVFQRGAQWMLPAPWSLLATGVGALVVLLVLPGGLTGSLLRVRDRMAFALVGRAGESPVDRAEAAAVTEAPAPSASTREAPAREAPAPEAPAPGVRGAAGTVAPLLEVRGLSAAYGDLEVVHGVDLDVVAGEVLAILGGNGAGKTSILRAITGTIAPTGGTVRLQGIDVAGWSADRIAAAGITQVPGGEGVFPGLTVAENLRMGGWLLRGDPVAMAEREREALDVFGDLEGRLDEPAANLSGGQQQMLALAMALMSRPTVLVIDELSLGLAPLVVGRLSDLVADVAAAGTAVVLVEQSLNLAMSMADRAVFVENGRVAFSGPAAELAGREDLLHEVFLASEYVRSGSSGANGSAPVTPAAGSLTDRAPAHAGVDATAAPAPVLVVSDVTRSFGGLVAVSQVSFDVVPGEILGLIGQNGAGKTTLVDLISGYQVADSGAITMAGRDITREGAVRRFSDGLGRTFQGGRLFGGLSVAEAIAVGLEQDVVSRGILDAVFRLPAWADSEAAVSARVDELVDAFSLEPYRDHMVSELSTGTRRIVELAAAVAHQPRLVLLDEPAAGLAQVEVEAMVGLLRRVRDDLGCAMVLIEHDMPLVAAISDRLVALESGSVIAEGLPADVLSSPLVIASYLGQNADARSRSGAVTPPAVPVPTARHEPDAAEPAESEPGQ